MAKPASGKRKKQKKQKYKTISLKLGSRQSRSFQNYCKARNTTPIKLIKKSIARYLNGYEHGVPEKYFVSEKQLDLFGEE